MRARKQYNKLNKAIVKEERLRPKRTIIKPRLRSNQYRLNKDFLNGQEQIDNYFAANLQEDGNFTERDDRSQDAQSQLQKKNFHSRSIQKKRQKKKLLPKNCIKNLLSWRKEMQDKQIEEATEQNSTLIRVSNICQLPLQEYANQIEALFINFHWDNFFQELKSLEKLQIQSQNFMKKGLAFIWTPKQLILQIMDMMASKGFQYVENLQVGIFDREKIKTIYKKKTEGKQSDEQNKNQKDTKPLQIMVQELIGVHPMEILHIQPYKYINKSKKTIYIFRKNPDLKLELRHQRNADIVFDAPVNPTGRCQAQLKNYLFYVIETLLPKCLDYQNGYKMMQLWGDASMRRRGWITMVQE